MRRGVLACCKALAGASSFTKQALAEQDAAVTLSRALASATSSQQPPVLGAFRTLFSNSGIQQHLVPTQAAEWHVAAARHVSGITATSPTQLAEIVKLSELMQRTPDEIATLWDEYHSDPKGGRVSLALTGADYQTLSTRAKESPFFILPLAKPGGYLTLLLQCQLPHVLVTPLAEYQQRGADAPAYLAVTHYTELQWSKDLVLVRGDIVHDKTISLPEARAILMLIRAFYCNNEDYSMVKNFNHAPDKFDFERLLAKLRIAEGGGGGAAPAPA